MKALGATALVDIVVGLYGYVSLNANNMIFKKSRGICDFLVLIETVRCTVRVSLVSMP